MRDGCFPGGLSLDVWVMIPVRAAASPTRVGKRGISFIPATLHALPPGQGGSRYFATYMETEMIFRMRKDSIPLLAILALSCSYERRDAERLDLWPALEKGGFVPYSYSLDFERHKAKAASRREPWLPRTVRAEMG